MTMKLREWHSEIVYVDSGGSQNLTDRLNELQKDWDIIENIEVLDKYYVLIVASRA